MKGKHYLLFLSALLCGVRSFAKDTPLFKEVAAMYFSHYAFPYFQYNLVFMKKRDGWLFSPHLRHTGRVYYAVAD